MTDNAGDGISVSFGVTGSVTDSQFARNAGGIVVSSSNSDPFEVRGNRVHDNASTGIYSGRNTVVANNEVWGHVGGSDAGIRSYGLTVGNTVYGNHEGIEVLEGVTEANATFGNTIGLYVGRGLAQFNTIASNATGVQLSTDAEVVNNLVLDNDTAFRVTSSRGEIRNNTIVQDDGTVVDASSSSASDLDFRNNIVDLAAGTVFTVSDRASPDFSSDYNLFDLGPAAGITFADWVGQTLGSDLWQLGIGLDTGSVFGPAGLADARGADGVLGRTVDLDGTADNDLTLAAGSLAIDAADPLTAFFLEPEENGDRANVGAYGASALAATSGASARIDAPAGIARPTVGQSTPVVIATSGVARMEPVLFVNVNGPATSFDEPWNQWQADGAYVGSDDGRADSNPNTPVLDVSTAPSEVMQTFRQFYASQPLELGFEIPDGTYEVTLHFLENYSTAANPFEIEVNGTVIDTVDGAGEYARDTIRYSRTYTVAVADGDGLVLRLDSGNGYLAGVEIARDRGVLAGAPTADLEVSSDGGATWGAVASGVELDRFGAARVDWTPGDPGATLLRVSTTGGHADATGQSRQPFMVTGGGNAYYVDDGSDVGDVFTLGATGDDANDGRSAATPMASLNALLNVYDLSAGDTVYIDTGDYELVQDLLIDAGFDGTEASPIRFVGAGQGLTVIDRANDEFGTKVIDLDGASHVAFEDMSLMGGYHVVRASDGAAAFTGITFDGIATSGSYVDLLSIGNPLGNNDVRHVGLHVLNSTFADTARGVDDGIAVAHVEGLRIESSTFRNLRAAIDGNSNLIDVRVVGNTIENVEVGIDLPATDAIVSGNMIDGGDDGYRTGIIASGSVTVSGNEVFGFDGTFGIGIDVAGGAVASGNEVYANKRGIEVGNDAVARDNLVRDNTVSGIDVQNRGTAIGNELLRNVVGLEMSSANSLATGNLVIGSGTGVEVQSTGAQARGNTIIQTGGIAFDVSHNFSYSPQTVVLRDNIVQLDGGVDGATAVRVNDYAQRTLDTDYNLLDLSGDVTLIDWNGLVLNDLDRFALRTGNDRHTIVGDAGFIDASGGDYRLSAGSLAVDAGDPTRPAGDEPGWGRLDIGHLGGTADAPLTAPRLVEVLSPNGLEKFRSDGAMEATWRTVGLGAFEAVAFLNAGGDRLRGEQPWALWDQDTTAPVVAERYGAGVSYSNGVQGLVDRTMDGAALPAAETGHTLLRSYGGAGGVYGYDLDLDAGDYTLRLHLVDFDYRDDLNTVDIVIDGVVVADGVNIAALAGGRDAVLVLDVDVLSDGAPVELRIVTNEDDDTGLLALEIGRAVASHDPSARSTVEVLDPTDGTWTTVANDVSIDRYGYGSATFDAPFVRESNDAVVRVTHGNGVAARSDVSDRGFLIARAGQAFFVDDGADLGDVWTPGAVGDDLNHGMSADAPMASLEALLAAYDLRPGDVVHVDSGDYTLLRDLVVATSDGGAEGAPVTILGPAALGGTATVDRAFSASDSRVFDLENVSHLTLQGLSITGAGYGVAVGDTVPQGSVREGLTLRDLEIFRTGRDAVHVRHETELTIEGGVFRDGLESSANGIEFTSGVLNVTGTEVFGFVTGIDASAEGGATVTGRISDVDVHDNSQYGIDAYTSTATDERLLIELSDVYENAVMGIQASGNVTIEGNTIFGHTAANRQGIEASSGAMVIGNTVYGNAEGIETRGNDVVVAGNRVFGNAEEGIYVSQGRATVERNAAYSNETGIVVGDTNGRYGVRLVSNIVYDNADAGIIVRDYDETVVVNNTVLQAVGEALTLADGATDTMVANNLLSVEAGAALDIGSTSAAGLTLERNLFDLGVAADLARWGAATYADVALLEAATGLATNSIEAAAMLRDIDGADNRLGYDPLTGDGGADDNFTPLPYSPLIDAANAYVGPYTDYLAIPRADDPAVANTGVGFDRFVEADAGASALGTNGVRSTGVTRTVDLPFAFPFYGEEHTRIWVHENGYIDLGDRVGSDAAPTLENLLANKRIAPLWSNLDLLYYEPEHGTFVDTSVADQVTVRWNVRQDGTAAPASFQATLFADGSIRFDYGAVNAGLDPIVGVSAGNGSTFVTGARNGSGDLSGASASTFAPTPGLVYFDIGAVEFRGASDDTTPPTIASIVGLPDEGGITGVTTRAFSVEFSEALDQVSANSAANYELRRAGSDGLFDTPDDEVLDIALAYSFPETSLAVVLDEALEDGLYRFTVSGALDTAANVLDGDDDGAAGGTFERTFRIGNSAPVHDGDIDIDLADTDAPRSIDLLAGASDPDGNALGVANLVLLSGDTAGVTVSGSTVTVDATAYQRLATGETETVSYGYEIADGEGGVTARTLTVTIEGTNQAPTVPGDLQRTLNQLDAAVAVLVAEGATDAEGDAISAGGLRLVSGPEAYVRLVDGVLTLDPALLPVLAPGESVTVTYAVDITDGEAAAERRISFTVTGEAGTVVRESTGPDGRRIERIYVDGVLRTRVESDPGTLFGWDRVVTQYDTSGVVTQRVYVRDDGRTVERNYQDGILVERIDRDPTDIRDWSTVTLRYDASGATIERTVVYDDASVSSRFFEDGRLVRTVSVDGNADAETWQRIEQRFDAAGALIERTYVRDDGRTVVSEFEAGVLVREIHTDPTNLRDWSEMRRTYDATGALVERSIDYDSGLTRTTRYSAGAVTEVIDEDRSDDETWQRIAFRYDAAGDLVERTYVRDDGRTVVSTFVGGVLDTQVHGDPTDIRNWTTDTRRFRPDGTLLEVRREYDDGRILVIDYDESGNEIARRWEALAPLGLAAMHRPRGGTAANASPRIPSVGLPTLEDAAAQRMALLADGLPEDIATDPRLVALLNGLVAPRRATRDAIEFHPVEPCGDDAAEELDGERWVELH